MTLPFFLVTKHHRFPPTEKSLPPKSPRKASKGKRPSNKMSASKTRATTKKPSYEVSSSFPTEASTSRKGCLTRNRI